MVFGTFDIFHLGHLYLFKQAKQLADKLVVVVARDCNVKKIKGVLPIHNEKERLELVKHIDIVDKAMLGYKNDVYKVIKKIKPDVIALGYDQEADVKKLTPLNRPKGRPPLAEFNGVKIVRLRAYKPDRVKGSKIKKLIEGII
jgi:FAD synthetase